MNILFLDDDAYRTKTFRSSVPSAITASTSVACIAALNNEKSWDFLFLDHDLGGMVYVDSARDDTGMEVVRWICEKKPEIKHIIVHSFNYPAACDMTRALVDAGYRVTQRPFDYKIGEMVYNIAGDDDD